MAVASQGFEHKFPFIASAAQGQNRLALGISMAAAPRVFLFGYDTGVIGCALEGWPDRMWTPPDSPTHSHRL